MLIQLDAQRAQYQSAAASYGDSGRFEREIDAAYRATVSSCRAYARCMQNNYYDEGQCRSFPFQLGTRPS